MEGRVVKQGGKYYVELPPEFASHERVEWFPLREGYYLLSVPLGVRSSPSPRSAPALTDSEKALLRKLSAIPFGQRLPSKVDRALGESEKVVLRTLLAKDYLNLFKGKKYPEGVYNIRDSVYPLLAGGTVPRPSPSSPAAVLSEGYAVFDTPQEASRVSEQLRTQKKSLTVVGIKGFDGKFYLVSKSYLSCTSPKILGQLDTPRSIEDLASRLGLPSPACAAVLHILGEQGEVVEKRKGLFALA